MAQAIAQPVVREKNRVVNAESVLRESWNGSIPVDPVAIANSMGIRVYEDPSYNTSGALRRSADGSWSIHLNPRQGLERKRFTVAHELGHLLLKHGPRNREMETNYNIYNFDPIERDANVFAAELLMPSMAVQHFVDKGYDLYLLAKKFSVSPQAMSIRLENLEIV